MSEPSPQPSAKDWQAVVARFNAEHGERFDPTYGAKHAALDELAYRKLGDRFPIEQVGDALIAAYAIDTPAIHAAGVAEGRAAMRDEIVEFVRATNGPDDPGNAFLNEIADAIEAAFPTTGEKTDG